MRRRHRDVVRRVASIPGATVEHNKFCVSVHFRNCEASQYNAVLGAVEATLRSRAELHVSRGRKVFEIKPQVLLTVTRLQAITLRCAGFMHMSRGRKVFEIKPQACALVHICKASLV